MASTVRRLAHDEKHKPVHELATEVLNAVKRCSPANQIVLDSESSLAGARPDEAVAETHLDVFEPYAAVISICSVQSSCLAHS